ncbi:MAG: hypothetical protein U0166_10155 [Acidobacteriota bacterium]
MRIARETIAALARETLVLLIVEDAQWADALIMSGDRALRRLEHGSGADPRS